MIRVDWVELTTGYNRLANCVEERWKWLEGKEGLREGMVREWEE